MCHFGPVSKKSAESNPADFVIQNGNILTVDAQFSRAQSLAVRAERIVLVGDNTQVAGLIGPNTRVLDAKWKTVLPGLYDSHVHSFRASVSESGGPMPVLKS